MIPAGLNREKRTMILAGLPAPRHRRPTHPPHERSRAECECDQWCVPSCPVHDAVEYSAAWALHKAESR